MIFSRKNVCRFLVLGMFLGAVPGQAKTMQESVNQAVLNHPSVQAAWHGFKASWGEQTAAKGGFRPKLDFSASGGREALGGEGYNGRDNCRYTRGGVYLTLSQMLYDGGLVRSQVKKFGYARNAKYYDLLAAMEKTALLAFRSHADVNRYKSMIILARQNLQRHQEILDKVEARFKAGLESAADVEIARGRFALAKVNLITEKGNLHDASTQYFRTVGVLPGDDLEEGNIDMTFASTPEEALKKGLERSPRRNSVKQSVLSTLYALEEQRSRLRPRLDLRGRLNLEKDIDGTEGRKDKAMVELVFSYNIFDGGANKATIGRFEELYMESKAILEKTNREVSQALLVAYNDIKSIGEQLVPLKQHQQSSEAMEKAYKEQFEVGRRSLLDLLDAQNEAFQAKRAYINALFTLEHAKASYFQESGGLVNFFNATPPQTPREEELGLDKALEIPE